MDRSVSIFFHRRGDLVTGDNPHSPIVALLVGVVTGGLLGLINGWIIAYLKIPPFVATLGMLSVALRTHLRGHGRHAGAETEAKLPEPGRGSSGSSGAGPDILA